jgi:hypothetical protein
MHFVFTLIGYSIGTFLAVGFLLSPVWVPLGAVALFQGHRRSKSRAVAAGLSARADFEHAALMGGNLRAGVFGAFPPPSDF